MSNKLDQDREKELQPKRIKFAVEQLTELGFEIDYVDNTRIEFNYKNQKVTFYPYSGWHSGKSIRAGRGWKKLKLQIS